MKKLWLKQKIIDLPLKIPIKMSKFFGSRVDRCLLYQYIRVLAYDPEKSRTPLGIELNEAASKFLKEVISVFGFEDGEDAYYYAIDKLGPCDGLHDYAAYNHINKSPRVIREFIEKEFPQLKTFTKFESSDKSLIKWFGVPQFKICSKLRCKGQKRERICGKPAYKNGVCQRHNKYGSV